MANEAQNSSHKKSYSKEHKLPENYSQLLVLIELVEDIQYIKYIVAYFQVLNIFNIL